MRLRSFFILGLVSLTGSCLTIGRADDTLPDDYSSRGVARVSILTGDVSVRRNDSGEFIAAAINAPVVAGDSIATGPSGRTELQFNSANMLRIGHDSEIRLTDLEAGRIGTQLARGTLTYSVLRDSSAQVEISTPTVSVRPFNRGTVRVSVLDDGQTEITVRSGQVEIYTPRGVETLGAGQTMIARGSASDPEFQVVAAIPRDAWDEWNDGRDRALLNSPSYQYVSQDISGAEDLDSYGQWVSDPSYGQVWSPRVAADWAPYRDGRWVSDDYYGWTWVGYEPWGWAPYHYGNWFRGSYGWCWYPGARYSHHYWRPAVVGFFGFGGRSSSFGFGFGNVGWVPLAPFETYRPWYGRGRSFNVVNNANIYNSFRNARYNGSTGIDARNFSGGRWGGGNFAVSRDHLSRAGIVQGGLPFRGSGASQRFSDRQASYVPRGNSFSRQFASRSGFQRSGGFNSGSIQPTPGNRDFRGRGLSSPGAGDAGWSRFGNNRGATMPQNGRSSAGFQSVPGNRDSGWNRFGGSRDGSSPANRDFRGSRSGDYRSGSTAMPQNSRGSAGFQSVPGNRDSGWSRFGGNRSSRSSDGLQSPSGNRDFGSRPFDGNRRGSISMPQSGRGQGSFQSPPPNQDFGGSRFGRNRGESMTMPPSGRSQSSFQSPPPNRDFGGNRFGRNRGESMTMPPSGRSQGSFQSPPPNRDFGGSRFGGNRGGSMTMPPSGRSGGYSFGSRGAAPMAPTPHQQSPQAFRSSPGFSNNSGGGMRSAPPSSGFSGGRSNDAGGSHRGRRER